MITASAPAKIILFGEHAVVYGQPALAVPVTTLRAHATVEDRAVGSGLSVVAVDSDETLPVDLTEHAVKHALAFMARQVLRFYGCQPPDAAITVTSDIPLASGLGSGAAVAAALGRALALRLGQQIPDDALNTLVFEVEKMHHGTPSGIDNTVIVYERPVCFVRGQAPSLFRVGEPVAVVVADTGVRALTRESVGDVRQQYDADRAAVEPLLLRIGSVVYAAQRALETGDFAALGALADENHALLRQLTLSSPELERLVLAARAGGALGAKLSGGGRGGNMIAFALPGSASRVEQAVLQAGAARAFTVTLGATPGEG